MTLEDKMVNKQPLGARTSRRIASTLCVGALLVAPGIASTAVAAEMEQPPVSFTGSGPSQPESTLEEGTFNEYIGENGRMLQYHYFENGDNGTVFYFDGDQTTNFHYPHVDSSVVHEPGVGNGHVQRINEEAAARGMDLIFLEHPHGEDVPLGGPKRVTGTSWWDYMDDSPGGEVDEYAEVVREIISASGAQNVQLVGYSGGAEFMARHLLVNGNDWLPLNTAATFIGGGGSITGPYEPAKPAAGRENMSYVYVVGLLDGTDPNKWSALEASRKAVAQWQSLGYSGAEIIELPDTTHYNYNYRGIVAERLDLLLANASDGSQQINTETTGRYELTIDATGFVPGEQVKVTATRAGRVFEFTPESGAAVGYDGSFKGTIKIEDPRSRLISPGRYRVSVSVGDISTDPVNVIVKRKP